MALLRFAPTVSFDINSSPTGEAFSLSTGVGFWGHSQGATHGAVATPYGDWLGVVFSGQGASLKDSMVTKTSPVNIAGVIGLVLQDLNSNGVLAHGARHPVLNLIQQYLSTFKTFFAPDFFSNVVFLNDQGVWRQCHPRLF